MPPRKGIQIRIGDKTKLRTIRYDNVSLERLQEETACNQWPDGMPLIEVMNQVGNLTIKTINTALWVGLLHAEPDLTREQVVRMTDTRSLDAVVKGITSALNAAMPNFEDEGDREKGNDES